MKNLSFDFENTAQAMKTKDRIVQMFVRAGCSVASAELDPKTYRTAGVSYRRIDFSFSDSQKVSLMAKLTGDIYQVLVNGKVLPMRAQEDPAKAVLEIATVLDMGRVAWQKKLTRLRTKSQTQGKRELVTNLMRERRLRASISEKSELLEEGRAQLAEIKSQVAAATV